MRKSFIDASPAERRRRAAFVAALAARGKSDVRRWRDPETYDVRWTERTMQLAALVRPGESVFEFGPGPTTAQEFLPETCRWTGGDLAPQTPDVVQLNLNGALPDLTGHDVALFSGVLEYVNDLDRLAAWLQQRFRAVVASYAIHDDPTPEGLLVRRYNGWVTDLDEAGVLDLFAAHGFRGDVSGVWWGQILFRLDA